MSDNYPAFAKIPRLYRDIVITEKIDGTNGLVSVVLDVDQGLDTSETPTASGFIVKAGSRNRWLTPDQDNFNFAKWVNRHADELAELGPGLHYGEWWGSGIQRGYGLANGEKRFSLFNTGRWNKDNIPAVPGLGVVPVLYEGHNEDGQWGVRSSLALLQDLGSVAVPGFMRPEGIVVYHTAARTYSKVTIEGDEAPKGKAA